MASRKHCGRDLSPPNPNEYQSEEPSALQLIAWSFSYGRSWLSAAKLTAPCFSTVDACLAVYRLSY
jgi:hypothetical protein